MKTYLFCLSLLIITLVGCNPSETDLEDIDVNSSGRGGGNANRDHTPGEPDRHWVPGCDSNGRSEEKNPHCVNIEEISVVSADSRFKNLHSIATDGEYLYVGGSDETQRAQIWRVSLESKEVTEIYSNWWTTRSGGWAFAIEVLGENLYVVDPNAGPITDTQVLRGPKNGLGQLTSIYTESRTPGMAVYDIYDGSGIATNGSQLFITDHVQGRVSSMSPDGSNPKYLGGNRYGGFFDVEHRNTVAHYDSTLYFADSADRGNCNCGDFTPQILSLPTQGGSFSILHEGAPLVHPYDIDVHPQSDSLVIVDAAANNTIFMMPRTGGTPIDVISGDPFKRLMGLVILGEHAYVIDTGDYQDPTTGQWINGPGKIFRVPLPNISM
jgi:hypothetical protein